MELKCVTVEWLYNTKHKNLYIPDHKMVIEQIVKNLNSYTLNYYQKQSTMVFFGTRHLKPQDIFWIKVNDYYKLTCRLKDIL